MKRLLVLGASQGTGALCVKEALARGHAVTAVARNPDKLGLDHANLTKVAGDFHNEAFIKEVVKGHDAVIITVASKSLETYKKNPNYFSSGTALVIDAVKGTDTRVVVLSAIGVGPSRAAIPWIVRLILIDWLLKLPYADHERQEALILGAKDLKWVIARPSGLTDKPGKKAYKKETDPTKGVPSSISRADVADFLVEAATTDTWIGKAVQLGG